MRALLFCACCCWSFATLGQEPKTQLNDPKSFEASKWEKEIAAFEAKDKEKPPQKGGTVFYGSSSIRLWKLDESFPNAGYVNRGFGGSYISDAVRYFERVVVPHAPTTLVIYAGDNDINGKRTAAMVFADYKTLHEKVKKQLPECRLVFIAIKPSPKRWSLADEQKKANEAIRKYMSEDPKQIYFDSWPMLLDANGKPKEELFQKDALHLAPEGYKLWTKELEKILTKK